MAQDRTSFYAAVGEAISAWKLIEDELERVLVQLLTPIPYPYAGAIFAGARHFETKLRIIDRMIKRRPDPLLRKKWQTLQNKLGRKVKKRHRLAHGGLVVSDVYDMVLSDGKIDQEFIKTHHSLSEDGPSKPLVEKDIRQLAAAFKACAKDVRDFGKFLSGRQPPWQKKLLAR